MATSLRWASPFCSASSAPFGLWNAHLASNELPLPAGHKLGPFMRRQVELDFSIIDLQLGQCIAAKINGGRRLDGAKSRYRKICWTCGRFQQSCLKADQLPVFF